MSQPPAPLSQGPVSNFSRLASASFFRHRWVIGGVLILGVFMAVMDISVVNVALPHMMGTFGVGIDDITWVATGYSIAEIVIISMAAWLSTLIGRKRYYIISFIVFIVGSVLSGMARSFGAMVVFRTIQGIGGGGLIPLALAILKETFPEEEQGMAMAIFGMGVVIAPAFGPVIGGWLTDNYNWPWIFFINVPVGLIAVPLAMLVIHDPPYLRRGLKRIDGVGLALLTVSLVTIQLALERGEREDWFESTWITWLLIVGVVSLVVLVIWEWYEEEPVVNVRLLKNAQLSVGSAIAIIFGVALFGSTFIVPQFLERLMRYPVFEAGLALLPRSLVLMVFMPIAGRLYNYVDARLTIGLGVLLTYWAYIEMSNFYLDIGFRNVLYPFFILGAGNAFLFVTLTTASLSTIDRRWTTDASSLYTLARRIGGNVGYAVVATLVERRGAFHRVRLVEHVTPFSPATRATYSKMTAAMANTGGGFGTARDKALKALDNTVNLQARMLAYNDVFWFLGIIFIAAIPLIFLLRGTRKNSAPA